MVDGTVMDDGTAMVAGHAVTCCECAVERPLLHGQSELDENGEA